MKVHGAWKAVIGLVLVVVALGCRSESEPERAGAGAKAKTDVTAPVAEETSVDIPDAPVSGSLFGKEFHPDEFELAWRGMLTLQQGEGVFPDAEVTLHLFLDSDASYTDTTWDVSSSDTGFGRRPHVRVSVKEEGANHPTSETYTEEYTLRLSFSETEDSLLAGRIYLELPDDSRSVFSGTFVVAPPVDPSAPLTDKDKPFVVGRIDFRIPGKGMLGTGYCGITSAGERQQNGAGFGIEPDYDGGSTWCDYFKPRITRLEIIEKQVARHRHVRLEPGTYLFYAKWEDTYLASRWLTIEAGSETTLDFTVNPQESGTLEVNVASEGEDKWLRLLPLDGQSGLPPGIDDDQAGTVGFFLGVTADIDQGKASFETLCPGAYRVFYGNENQDVVVKQGETATVKFP
jgi:hypothetical protein